MQCEGITRAGYRCRNRALDDEIFCEVHMRVNRTYNLALLVPFLTTLLLCYFFVFGLFFETLHYGVFDLNYLKYAGLTDLLISMFRTGGMLTVVVLKLWVIYAVIVGIIFGIWLIVSVTRKTSHKHLKPVRRLKIIGLSLGIFFLNILHRFVVLVPKRNRRHPSQILVGREHLALSLQRHKKALAPVDGPDPFQAATDIYRRFLAVSTFNNHRFFVTILMLALASSGSIIYAGHEAQKMRKCIIQVADKKIVPAEEVPASSLYPGLNMSPLCQNSLSDLPEEVDVSDKFRRSLTSFFTFPVVLLARTDETDPLLYLGATDRFELFFNGKTRLPFSVPNENLEALYGNGDAASSGRLKELETRLDDGIKKMETRLSGLEEMAQRNGKAIGMLEKSTEKQRAANTANLERKLLELEQSAEESGFILAGLQQGLDRIGDVLNTVEMDHTKRIVGTIPDSCWQTSPHMVVTFKVGSTQVTGAETKELIRRLATDYTVKESRFIVISGHSDPSGSTFDNYRLSRARAEEVHALMRDAGIDSSALYMIGRGEDHSNSLPRRRVEIRDCTPAG
ncbi:OmpA family protein [uncultured Sneathiella sp.]|uniref:OmpA family protein n=1 Tax=uncultured Sneathiella sp. TaxID=879315 RepID=UPI0030ED0354|tara:strand:+ start:16236 stop:17933 length:1698 start_codon:yes stop_codon:yes gene_type:complete